MEEVPLEVRLELLFLKAACSDSHLDAIEVDTIASYLQPVLDQLGSTVSTKALIQISKQRLADHGLVDSSIKQLSEQLSNVVLARMLNQIIALASVGDNEANQEDRGIERLASSWQLEISEIDVTNEGSRTKDEAAESKAAESEDTESEEAAKDAEEEENDDSPEGEAVAYEDGDDGETDEHTEQDEDIEEDSEEDSEAEQSEADLLVEDEGEDSEQDALAEEQELVDAGDGETDSESEADFAENEDIEGKEVEEEEKSTEDNQNER